MKFKKANDSTENSGWCHLSGNVWYDYGEYGPSSKLNIIKCNKWKKKKGHEFEMKCIENTEVAEHGSCLVKIKHIKSNSYAKMWDEDFRVLYTNLDGSPVREDNADTFIKTSHGSSFTLTHNGTGKYCRVQNEKIKCDRDNSQDAQLFIEQD